MIQLKTVLDGVEEEVEATSGFMSIMAGSKPDGYITAVPESKPDENKIILPDYFIKKIIECDDEFGVLVGGRFFYFNMLVEVVDLVLSYRGGCAYLESIRQVKLIEGGRSKIITF